MSTVVPTVLPGPCYGHRIGETIAETWIKLFIGLKPLERFDPLVMTGNGRVSDLMAIVTTSQLISISLNRIIYRAIALSLHRKF